MIESKIRTFLDNLRGTDPGDGFAPVFLKEKDYLIPLITIAAPQLAREVEQAADELRGKIEEATE